jgi:ABC-type transporter Mla MlaB component
MPFSVGIQEGRQILALEGSVTIRDARKLAALLNEKLDERMPLEVETARLDDIDTCILQLLCSLKKTAAELTFADPPYVFLSALDRSQLRRALLGARESE